MARTGCKLWWAAWMWLALLPAGQALSLQVRSGEHDGFSRLVIDLPDGADWMLGRSSAGYEFRILAGGSTFDLTDVFTRIPRSRLADLTAAGDGLLLSVAPDVHAKAYETADKRVVIDIADGSAPEGSPFERPVDRASSAASATEPARGPAPATDEPPIATGASLAATLSFRPKANDAASLPIYWRNLADIDESADQGAGPVAAGHATATPAAAQDPVLPLVFAQEPPALLSVPRPEILSVEDDLRRQVSRAAAQGLAEPRPGNQPATQARAPKADPTTPKALPATAEKADDRDRIAYHAETSMDRDARDNPNARPVTNDGQTCLKDEALNIRSWGTGEPATTQISVARNGLTGEFDRPVSAAVRNLARLYLFFGMGAEARQTITAFNLMADDTDVLLDLGAVMDGLPVRSESPLLAMNGCETVVALWSFLATEDKKHQAKASIPAILRGFSGLPAHLRLQFGGRLSDRLIGIGALDAAKAVRNAVARTTEGGNRALGMIDAEIALGQGHPEIALPDLDRITMGNDDLSLRATVLALRTKLENGAPVGPAEVDAIAALAFENRLGAGGSLLAQLEIAARAASGDFATAFDRYGEEEAKASDAGLDDTLDRILAYLVNHKDDAVFLTTYFDRKDLIGKVARADTRIALAGRLSGLGFGSDVRALLTKNAAESIPEGQLLLARAALDLFEPETALDLTTRRGDAPALTLRADALAMLNKHLEAAQAFRDAGAPDRAAEAAWRGGDLAGAAADSAPLGQVLDGLPAGPLPATDTANAAVTLSASRSALEDSVSFRAALAQVMADPALAADPSAEAAPQLQN